MSSISGAGGGSRLPPIVNNADSSNSRSTPQLRSDVVASNETYSPQTPFVTAEALSLALNNLRFPHPEGLRTPEPLTGFPKHVANAVENMKLPMPNALRTIEVR